MNEEFYKPLAERTPDTQYRNSIMYILRHGELIKKTAQGVGALTCFGTVPQMVFDLSNGVPIIPDRSCIGFWRKPIAEITAFINGARTLDELLAWKCDLWEDYRHKDVGLPFPTDDLGPGSYGPAFHDYPMPNGEKLNQFEQLLEQIQNYPDMRTHRVTPWIPFWTARGPRRMVNVAPCHGELHFRVMNGKLHMRMDQRSADFPTGVVSNMIQYTALFMGICQVTGYQPGNYIHSFSDAHIYENQVESMEKLIRREPRPFPILRLDPSVKNLFDLRAEHFTLEEYDPHPAMDIPYSP